ncbi:MAG: DNA repair protein RecN [Prevotellaceae bacterium]|nr:DNA repair protein RecN [Prevotellaceae bacterium]
MLQALYIQNYALIERLDIRFETGFSVITGETGAGKSILLGALGLLLGQRADARALRAGATKCVVEARFDVGGYALQPLFEANDWEYDTECIVRRELLLSGKSRAFINDTPVTLSQLKELGDRLVDIHSQHQNLLLNREGFQLDVLDIVARDGALLDGYTTSYTAWREALQALERREKEAEQGRAEEEFLRFQWEQLEAAHLKAGEQAALEQEAEMLGHAEEIQAALYHTDRLLTGDEEGTLNALNTCRETLGGVRRLYPAVTQLSERMESAYIELKDIAREVAGMAEGVESNPARLEAVNERLDLLYTLQRKHHVSTVEELLALAQSYNERLAAITSCDEEIAALRQRVSALQQEVMEKAALLTKARLAAAREVERQLAARLVPIGMPHVRFHVETGARKEPGPQGADSVTFLFSANKSGVLQPLSSVASGGEISRIMLSIKAMVAGATQLPTIIFDEIDTGVSGEIADRMGGIMQEMGAHDRQVISITHLPQIAARGRVHYKVYKQEDDSGSTTRIRRLTDEERVGEIACMLSGSHLSDAALDNARVLLHTGGEARNGKEQKETDNGEK